MANSIDTCPVCKSNQIKRTIEINDMPVYCNVLWDSHAQAMAVNKGDIHLGYCLECGHVYNRTFDEALMDYTEDYENSLHFSPKFNQYAEELAQRLVDKYDIKHKDIVEIGCGKGDFLKMLCDRGSNKGHGFDKSFDPARSNEPLPGNITFHQDFYGDNYSHLNPDLICCRHVLEHIEDPQAFLINLRKIIGDKKPVVYFEVPNVLFTLKDMGIWDLIYEHCGYFSESSLSTVFQTAGFDIREIGESFGGQFLYIEATPTNSSNSNEKLKYDLREINNYVNEFESNYRGKVEQWRSAIENLNSQHSQAVVWGAGSKGVTFLNVITPGNTIQYVIDLNPHKHEKYVPGTGQQVQTPEFLRTNVPDKIIVMNPIYANEISGTVEAMGLNIDVSCV